jgi:4a-hydroxytetrahydrobiopterin dehydratase
MTDYITPKQFHEASGTEDWRVIGDGACAFYATANLAQSAQLVDAIARLPGVDSHSPDIDVRPDGVTVRLLTKDSDYYGMSQRDVEVAGAITAAAHDVGLKGDPAQVQGFLVIAGSSDPATVMPFWQAILGYDRRPDTPDEDLVDPHLRNASFWFEQMKEPRADRGGGDIHVSVWLPYDQAQARVDAARAAGGRMVRDHAPQWWTLADSAGNECDVSSVEGRD